MTVVERVILDGMMVRLEADTQEEIDEVFENVVAGDGPFDIATIAERVVGIEADVIYG